MNTEKKKKVANGEQKIILQSLSIKTLKGLYKMTMDPEIYTAVRSLLTIMAELDQKRVVSSAAVASSMDTMIDITVKAAFYRGKMAFAPLLNSIIRFAPTRLEELNELDTTDTKEEDVK